MKKKKQISTIEDLATMLQKEFLSIQDQFKDVHGKMDKGFAEVHKKMDKGFADVDKRLVKLEVGQEKLEKRMRIVESGQKDIKLKLENTPSRYEFVDFKESVDRKLKMA